MRGSVVKKPNGRYYIVYTVGTKQKWEKVPEPNTKKNSEKLLAQRVTEINRGEYREIKKVTFAEFAERWLSDYVDDPNHIKPSSAEQYRSVFSVHLMPFFAEYALTDLTPDLVQGFVSELSKSGLSPDTIRNILAPLTRMLKHAVQWGYLRSSPMPFVQKPRLQHRERPFLSPGQVRVFLEHVPSPLYPFFVTATLTGLRLGELLAMRWANLDWDNAAYNVRERIYKRFFNTPKSRGSVRAVDLSPKVIEALRGHRTQQNKTKLLMGSNYEDTDLIFCRENGGPRTNNQPMRRALIEALKAAGCPVLRFHDLRHTYAALLIAQGASPKYIQAQLGHASIKMTLDIYGHLMQDTGQEVVRKLDKQIFGGI